MSLPFLQLLKMSPTVVLLNLEKVLNQTAQYKSLQNFLVGFYSLVALEKIKEGDHK